MPKRLKKVPRNVNIEDRQWRRLKKLGLTENFSHNIRKLIELGLMMLDFRIIKDLSDDAIAKIRKEFADEPTRAAVQELKITEYREIFEELAKSNRYEIPEMAKLPNILFRINSILFDYSFKKYKDDPKFHSMLQKIAKYSRMIKDIKTFYENPDDKFPILEIIGDFPYTLLHYVKELLLVLSRSENHWKVIKTIPDEFYPMENMRKIRLYFDTSDSIDEPLEIIEQLFCNLALKLKDEENKGIWDDLNTPHHYILDQECLNFLKYGKGETPFENMMTEIEKIGETDLEKCIFLLNFYKKVHLISDVEILQNLIRFRHIDPYIIEILRNTLNQWGIEYEMKKSETLITLTFKPLS